MRLKCTLTPSCDLLWWPSVSDTLKPGTAFTRCTLFKTLQKARTDTLNNPFFRVYADHNNKHLLINKQYSSIVNSYQLLKTLQFAKHHCPQYTTLITDNTVHNDLQYVMYQLCIAITYYLHIYRIFLFWVISRLYKVSVFRSLALRSRGA